MAQAIMNLHYCDQCGMLVSRQSDLLPAHAMAGDKIICSTCSGKNTNVVPAARKKDSARQKAQPSEVSIVPAAPAPVQERRPRPTGTRSAAPAGPSPLVIGGISFGVVVMLFGAWVVLRKGSDAPVKSASNTPVVSNSNKQPETRIAPTPNPPVLQPVLPGPVVQPPATVIPTPAKPNVTTPPVDDYDPRKETSNLMLKQAKEWFEKNSSDVYGYREKLQTLKDRYNGTPAATEAAQIIPTLKLPPPDPNTNPELSPEADWANATQVLTAVDVGKDRINSNWSYHHGVLRSDRSTWARIGLPYTLPEDYDLRLTFSRPMNGDCLLIVLARRGKPFIFSIGSGNKYCSFEDIREKGKDFFPTKTQRDNLIPNEQLQQVVVQVRNQCLRGYLNGKPIVGCQVDDDGISLKSELQLPTPNQIGLCTWATEYQFTKLEVLSLKGTGKFLR